MPMGVPGVPGSPAFDFWRRGRPFEASRPYMQSIFRSRQASHLSWPEHRILRERQNWQLRLIARCTGGIALDICVSSMLCKGIGRNP